MSGNASVSLFDTGNNSLVENYFYAQNNQQLGDVAQSMKKINNEYYIVVNNSAKIVVCDLNFKYKRSISGFISPRYILPVSNQKAYVSDLYANAISIVNLNTGSKTGSIACNGWTEQMVMFYNKVFVSNVNSNYLYVINAINDQLEDSILIGSGCGSLVIDKNDQLWALTAASTSQPAKLWKINPLNINNKTAFNFNTGDKPGSLCINGGKDTLYYLNNGICRLTINNAALQVPIIEKGNKNFYALAVNPRNGDVYVSDALDYIQKSNIYSYKSSSGEVRNQFKAGIIAGNFYFE
jgi:DNA-binding beta-propeller fold protein YncE